jgi:preprotein translocase subunit YajC
LIAYLYYEKQKKRQKELEERIKKLEEKQTW